MTAPPTTTETISIHNRTVAVGDMIQVQKKGRRSTVANCKVMGWTLDDRGEVRYLSLYGGRPGYLGFLTATLDQVHTVPTEATQARMRDALAAWELPKARARKGAR